MKNNIKNLEAAKELVKKYQSITIEQIEKIIESKSFYSFFDIINEITGFGNPETCILCKNIDTIYISIIYCKWCIYKELTDQACNEGKNRQSYIDIKNAHTKNEFLEAIKKRAEHLQSLIDKAELED